MKEPRKQIKETAGSQWNYLPQVPLEDNSLFKNPLSSSYLVKWFVRNWLHLGEKLLLVILATLTWLFFYPPLEDAETWSWVWVFQTWMVNLFLICLQKFTFHLCPIVT